MPDQLTAPSRPPRGGSGGTRGRLVAGLLLQAVAVVGILAVAGALAGVLWFWLWTPPEGVVSEGRWFTDEDGLRSAFSGTGLYLLVAVGVGFAVGAVTSYFLDRSELLTLVATAVGACLAGWLMLRLGLEWSPPDPEVVARTAEDGTMLDGRLTVDLPHAWLAFPAGALLGMAVVFLTTTRREPGHPAVERPDA